MTLHETTASWSPAERAAFDARRRSRNRALGLLLGSLAALFFGITIVRMAPALQPKHPAPIPASAMPRP